MPALPLQPVFILVNPQMGENIGATARAMWNFGLHDLRLISPRDGWPSEKAEAMSAGALGEMPEVRVFATLTEAIADCTYILSSAANERDMMKPIVTPRHAAQDIVSRLRNGERVAVLLGRERTGLTNEEVALSHAMITIPVNPDFNSLNIAQASSVIAYEIAQAQMETDAARTPLGKTVPATADEFDNFMRRLEEEIDKGGFFRAPELRPSVTRNIRTFFMRAEPTAQEISTLHGIITTIKAGSKRETDD